MLRLCPRARRSPNRPHYGDRLAESPSLSLVLPLRPLRCALLLFRSSADAGEAGAPEGVTVTVFRCARASRARTILRRAPEEIVCSKQPVRIRRESWTERSPRRILVS